MNVATTYKQAVNVLKPNRARMAAIHAEHRAIIDAATSVVETRMAATGKTGTELYREACANRKENETELDKAVRVVLLGMARKGK